MKVVVQRVSQAQVNVDSTLIGQTRQGYLLLVGIEQQDSEEDCVKAAEKIAKLRIFEDEDDKMNLSIQDIGGSVLSVSQFTLAADIHKGNRPSFTGAMRPELANSLFERFNEILRNLGLTVETGSFGAHMHVSLVNDGPVTILLETKEGKVI